MISMDKINNVNYHLEHSQHDYYSENDNEKGIFKGSLMRYQKLENKEVSEKEYLKQISHGGDLNKGIDICFSPPKDWTLIYNLVDDDTRKKMEGYRDNAVNAICKAIEQNTYIRTTGNGKTRYELAKAIGMAIFNHHTSREVKDKDINPLGIVDAQEHTHITVFPKALSHNNQFYSHTLLEAKYEKDNGHETLRYFDQVGQYELAKGLQELGFNLYEADKHSNFAVAGITDELREQFSKRSQQIDRLAGANATYNDKKNISLKVRAGKDDHNLSELRVYWKDNAKALGFDSNKINGIKQTQTDKPKSLTELMSNQKLGLSNKKLKTFSLGQAKFSTRTNTELLKEYKEDKKLLRITKQNFIYAKTDNLKNQVNTFRKASIKQQFDKSNNKSTSKPANAKPKSNTKGKSNKGLKTVQPKSNNKDTTSIYSDISRLKLDLMMLDITDINYGTDKANIESQIGDLNRQLEEQEKTQSIDTQLAKINNSSSLIDLETQLNDNNTHLVNKLLDIEKYKDITEGVINKKLNEELDKYSLLNSTINKRYIVLKEINKNLDKELIK